MRLEVALLGTTKPVKANKPNMNKDSTMKKRRERNVSVDLARVLACLGVLTLHLIGRDSGSVAGCTYFLAGFSIPVLFMASGYFVLNRADLGYRYAARKAAGGLPAVTLCLGAVCVCVDALSVYSCVRGVRFSSMSPRPSGSGRGSSTSASAGCSAAGPSGPGWSRRSALGGPRCFWPLRPLSSSLGSSVSAITCSRLEAPSTSTTTRRRCFGRSQCSLRATPASYARGEGARHASSSA